MKLGDIFGQPAQKIEVEKREPILIPLLENVMEIDNEREFEPANEPVFRASGIGYCGRKLLYELRGWFDAKSAKEIFTLNVGTEVHELLQEYLKKVPGLVESMEDEITIPELPGVTGHFDGLLKINGERYLLEIKTCNVEAFQRLTQRPDPYAKHKVQATFYMKSLGVTKALFLYVNKNGHLLGDFAKENPDVNPVFLEISYNFDEKLYQQILDKIGGLKEHFANKTMPEYKRVSECDYCTFKDQCIADRKIERKFKKEQLK